MLEKFEQYINEDLTRYLRSEGEIDERMPDMPDMDEKWQGIAESYIPDGIREFGGYPTVSLGWMMYVGMAVAKYWDTDWEVYGKLENIYLYLRDQRGYDCMDEYISEKVLMLKDENVKKTASLVAECASRTYANLRRQGFEPGTKDAFKGYLACLKQLYRMGVAVQLYRMGYKMVAQGY